ncbi:putative calcium/calmodulin-dependent protein kinase [Helianthus annuus]|nr:putative calcium/calmodulin-dependent protein kinase [Helianthus annuus]
MAIESSMTQEIGGKKALQSDCPSPDSSLTQGDSDMESTSVSSSMQGSISSATSSLDQYSSNVKEETLQKKPLKKLNSRKFASFGSFMSSRRRAQSKLSQSSIKLSDDGSTSTTPLHPSSIEVSDESTNYVQKPMPKFTRTGSLRSVRIFRTNSKNRNKNKTSYKSKTSSTDTFSQASEESHVERATFSSTLKDSKFPEQLKHQSRPSEPEEVLPVAKVCRYQHCSLHGHHHHHEPPTKRFTYLKRRTAKDPKITNTETRPADKSFGKKREPKVSKKVSECKDEVDSSIEFYAKTRSEPLSSYDHDEAEFADMLFGVNSLQERKNEIPVSNNRDFSDLNNEKDDNSNGSKPVLEKKRSVKKKNTISMWGMIHQHMVSGLAAESADSNVQKVDEEPKSETKDFDDAASQETELRKMFAIKLVRDAIEKILLPEVQDDQSTTSEVISEQDVPEKIETPNEQTDESPAPVPEQKPAMKLKKEAPSRWSHLKKVILLTKFVKELEKVKKFKPRKPSGQDDPPESGCNDEIQRVGSESKDILQETSETNPSADKIEEPKPDLEKEKHLKMWHMIYQHVAVDIATKIGSDLLLDDEESTNGDENNPQEVENQTERNYKLQFTQSDAVKLVRESVDEILLPDTTDTSSQDSQSVASDTASEQEEVVEKKHEDAEPRKLDENKNPTKTTILHHQKSKNWAKLKKLILLKRSIRALEGFRTLKSETPQREKLKTDSEQEKVDLRRQMMDERKKAEQWMLDYAVQHIVTKLTPSRKKRVSMLVEAFEAVVPLPEI